MSTQTPHNVDSIDLETPEQITDVAQLSVGDRVLIDDRVMPQTVIRTGRRPIESRKTGEVHQQEVVKVQGDWSNAKEIVLANQYDFWAHEDTGEVVEMQSGNEVDLRRTELAGSRDRGVQRQR